MEGNERIIAAIFAAAKCAGKGSEAAAYLEAYDRFLAMAREREPMIGGGGLAASPAPTPPARRAETVANAPIRTENRDPPLSDERARELSARTRWYHRFELRPGLVTAGVSEMAASDACDALGVPSNLAGCKALDVGAYDGPITFELERRGARAMALDILDPTQVGFDAARKILGSHALHYRGSVYQLPHDEMMNLDIIVFRGVYYELKHPLLAFERCAMALKIGGTLHFEGEALEHYVEDLDGRPAAIDLTAANEAGVPLCAMYPGTFRGASNWAIPNRACLRNWIESCGLDIERIELWRSGDVARLFGYARKTREPQTPAEASVLFNGRADTVEQARREPGDRRRKRAS